MRLHLTVGLTAVVLGLSIMPQPVRAQEPLPAVSLRLGCHDEGTEATQTEVDGIESLLEFARQNDGMPVYLDAVIAANDGAGSCSRDLSEHPNPSRPEPMRATISFDPCRRAGEDGGRCSRPDVVSIRAMGPPLAVTLAVILPAQDDLPLSLPYRLGGYGSWLNYQGPFIVRFHSATGAEHVTFDVPDPDLSAIWERAAVNAAAREIP